MNPRCFPRLVLLLCATLLPCAALWGLEPPHDSTNGIDCSDCHAMHGSGMLGAVIPRGAAQETQCKTCHNPTGQAGTPASMHSVTNHKVNGGATIVDCGSCHDPHAPMASTDTHGTSTTADNLSLVRSDPDKYVSTALTTAVFQESPDHFVFATSPYNGICQACHTLTDYYANDGSGDTHFTSDCSQCHKHVDGFLADADDCSLCHDVARGDRRAVLGDFDDKSHHLQGTSLDVADCKVCHEMTEHKEGDVRLNASTVVVLTGDPASSATQAAKLEAWCLDCHDGSLTSAPFSDGEDPPVIDATAWGDASHNSDAITCFGNGTFGCHASGHGSLKVSLLAPFGSAATSPAYEEEQEGFCFNCHTSGGSASSDIESDFPSTINWVTNAVGPNSSTTINDRHDVEYAAQNTSGAVIECHHCHDVHAATDSMPLLADPDPGDGHDPGDSDDWYLTGSDAMTEWCLDCHDGSFPSGVSGPSKALANIKNTYASDAHGDGSGNPSLKSGYGWASEDFVQCLDCHAPHAGERTNQNLFQLKDAVYSKDGTTAVPCDRDSPNEYVYEATDNDANDQNVNGYHWCNTCHTGSMGGKKDNCFGCHYHGKNN